MYIIIILLVLIYLIFNAIITISWLADNPYKRRGATVIGAILLLLFGLPTMIIVFIVAVIISIVNGGKSE